MLSKSLLSLFALSAASLAQAATTFTVPIAYEDEITVAYYFRDGNDLVSVSPNEEGLQFTVDAETADVCNILSSGMVVYAADGATDNTLLSWNQYDVFHLMDSNGNPLSWTSTNAQACPVAGGASASGSASASASSASVPSGSIPSGSVSSNSIPSGSVSSGSISSGSASSGSVSSGSVSVSSSQVTSTGSQRFTVLSSVPLAPSKALSTTVTTIDGIVTQFTTFCPLTTVAQGEAVYALAKDITSTISGVESVYTSFYPISTQYSASASATATGTTATTFLTKATVTTTVNGAESVYTTTYPTTGVAEAQGTETSKTVVTTTINGSESVYTTICPISGAVVSTNSTVKSTGSVTSAAGTTSGSIVQYSTTLAQAAVSGASLSGSSVQPSSSVTLTAYEGMGSTYSFNNFWTCAAVIVGSILLA